MRGRVIDLSVVAAKQLGTYDRGLAKVRLEVVAGKFPCWTNPTCARSRRRNRSKTRGRAGVFSATDAEAFLAFPLSADVSIS